MKTYRVTFPSFRADEEFDIEYGRVFVGESGALVFQTDSGHLIAAFAAGTWTDCYLAKD